MGSNRPPKVTLSDTDIAGDIHDCPSLGPGARKPARNKVTPLQSANAASKSVIVGVCSGCGRLERPDCIFAVVCSRKVPEKGNLICNYFFLPLYNDVTSLYQHTVGGWRMVMR